MRLLKFVAICMVVSLVTLTIPLIAGSLARPQVKPWPTDRPIRVYNPTVWQQTVEKAMEGFNTTGITPRLTQVADPKRADVIIAVDEEEVDERCEDGQKCTGYASHIGYREGMPTLIFLPDEEADADSDLLKRHVRLAAHEFGHVFGLRHTTEGCSLMNQDVGSRQCGDKRLGTWESRFVCGPLVADISRLAQLYQQRIRKPTDSTCLDLSNLEATFTDRRASAHFGSPAID